MAYRQLHRDLSIIEEEDLETTIMQSEEDGSLEDAELVAAMNELDRMKTEFAEVNGLLQEKSEQLLQLKTKNQELECKVKESERKQTELNEALRDKEEQIYCLGRENEHIQVLREKMAGLQEQCRQLQEQVEVNGNARCELEDSLEENDEDEELRNKLEVALAREQAITSELEEVKVKLMGKMEDVEVKFAGCEKMLLEATDFIQKVKEELPRLHEENEFLGKENETLREEVAELRAALVEKTRQHEESLAEIGNLGKQAENLRNSLEDLAESNRDLRRCQDDLEEQRAQLVVEINSRLQESSKIKEEKRVLLECLEKVKEEVKALKQSFVALEPFVAQEKSYYSELVRKNDDLMRESVKLKAEVQTLLQNYRSQLDEPNQELAKENRTLKEQVQMLLSRLEEADERSPQVLELTEENGELRKQVQELRLTKEQTENELVTQNAEILKLTKNDEETQTKEETVGRMPELLWTEEGQKEKEVMEQNEELKKQVQELLLKLNKEGQTKKETVQFSFGDREPKARAFTMGDDFPRIMTRRSRFRGSMPGHMENWFWTKQEIYAEKRAKSF